MLVALHRGFNPFPPSTRPNHFPFHLPSLFSLFTPEIFLPNTRTQLYVSTRKRSCVRHRWAIRYNAVSVVRRQACSLCVALYSSTPPPPPYIYIFVSTAALLFPELLCRCFCPLYSIDPPRPPTAKGSSPLLNLLQSRRRPITDQRTLGATIRLLAPLCVALPNMHMNTSTKKTQGPATY